MCYTTRYFIGLCRRRRSFEERFAAAVEALGDIEAADKSIIRDRFIDIAVRTEHDYNRTTATFLILTNLITIGGVFLVSFLTMEKLTILPEAAGRVFFWICWSLSIIITIANKSLYGFNVPKKYILNIITLEKYQSEGWQFVGKIGRYADLAPAERIREFLARIEHIKIKSLEALVSVDSANIERHLAANKQLAPPALDAIRCQ